MRRVSTIDATGLHALEEFYHECRRQGTTLRLSGVHAQPMYAFARAGFDSVIGAESIFGNIDDAMNRACGLLRLPPQPGPAGSFSDVVREQTSR